MRTFRFKGSTIKILSQDIKSEKTLTGKNAEIMIDKEPNCRYFGKISKGIPHGYGVKTWPNGAKYKGNWNKGRMHGQGQLIIAAGESYQGAFKNGLPWGVGFR